MDEKLPKEIIDTLENIKVHIDKAFVHSNSELVNSLIGICAEHSYIAGLRRGIEKALEEMNKENWVGSKELKE